MNMFINTKKYTPCDSRLSRGFTIIEVMISMAIFTIIVTIGIGAVLDAMTQHHNTENNRTVMDSLNFIMEDMARNIRLGTNVRCVTDAAETIDGAYDTSSTAVPLPVIPASCPLGSSQIVLNDLNGNHLRYLISLPTAPVPNQIMKASGDVDPQFLTPREVTIDPTVSGFTVRGAETSATGDFSQPTVTIRLAGTINYKNVVSKFAIQTTVALRALDS